MYRFHFSSPFFQFYLCGLCGTYNRYDTFNVEMLGLNYNISSKYGNNKVSFFGLEDVIRF